MACSTVSRILSTLVVFALLGSSLPGTLATAGLATNAMTVEVVEVGNNGILSPGYPNLKIRVKDAQGNALSGARVRIENPVLIADSYDWRVSESAGLYTASPYAALWPALALHDDFTVVVEKDGYDPVRTALAMRLTQGFLDLYDENGQRMRREEVAIDTRTLPKGANVREGFERIFIEGKPYWWAPASLKEFPSSRVFLDENLQFVTEAGTLLKLLITEHYGRKFSRLSSTQLDSELPQLAKTAKDLGSLSDLTQAVKLIRDFSADLLGKAIVLLVAGPVGGAHVLRNSFVEFAQATELLSTGKMVTNLTIAASAHGRLEAGAQKIQAILPRLRAYVGTTRYDSSEVIPLFQDWGTAFVNIAVGTRLVGKITPSPEVIDLIGGTVKEVAEGIIGFSLSSLDWSDVGSTLAAGYQEYVNVKNTMDLKEGYDSTLLFRDEILKRGTAQIVLAKAISVDFALAKPTYVPSQWANVTPTLMDQFGNPLDGASVTFAVQDSAGSSVVSGNLTPQGNGQYQAAFAMPASPGTYTLKVTASKAGYQSGAKSVSVSVSETVSGLSLVLDRTSVTVGAGQQVKLTATVAGNSVAGQTVVFSADNSGRWSGSTAVTTDQNGQATIHFEPTTTAASTSIRFTATAPNGKSDSKTVTATTQQSSVRVRIIHTSQIYQGDHTLHYYRVQAYLGEDTNNGIYKEEVTANIDADHLQLWDSALSSYSSWVSSTKGALDANGWTDVVVRRRSGTSETLSVTVRGRTETASVGGHSSPTPKYPEIRGLSVGALDFTGQRMAISPDSSNAAIVDSTRQVWVWNLSSGESASFKPEGNARAVGISNDGQYLVVASDANPGVKVYNISNFQGGAVLRGERRPADDVDCSRAEPICAWVGRDEEYNKFYWSASTLSGAWVAGRNLLDSRSAQGYAIRFSPDGQLVAVAWRDWASPAPRVDIYRRWDSNLQASVTGPSGDEPRGLAWSPDSTKIAVRWLLNSRTTVHQASNLADVTPPGGIIAGNGQGIAWLDDQRILTDVQSGAAAIVDVSTGSATERLTTTRANPSKLYAVSPNPMWALVYGAGVGAHAVGDKTGPTVAIESPSVSAALDWTSTTVTVQGTVVDDVKVESAKVQVNEGTATPLSLESGGRFSTTVPNLRPGQNVISVSSSDANGNESTNRLVLVRRPDVDLRVSQLLPDPPDLYSGGKVAIRATIDSLGMSVPTDAQVRVTIGGPSSYTTQLTATVNAAGPVNFEWDTAGLVPGAYDLTATAAHPSDSNLANNSASASIVIRAPPPPTITANAEGGKYQYKQGETVGLVVDVTASGSRVRGATVTYLLTGMAAPRSGVLAEQGEGVYKASFTLPTTPGVYNLRAVASKQGFTDGVGDFPRSLIVNDLPPETFIIGTSPREGETVSGNRVTFEWIGVDLTSPTLLYSYKLNEGPWSPYSTETSHTFAGLSEGTQRVYVRAKDGNGNEDSTPAQRTFHVVIPASATPSPTPKATPGPVPSPTTTPVPIITPQPGQPPPTVTPTPIPCDSYEPDNGSAQAKLISTDGVSQIHDFCVPGDEDWLKFSASKAMRYTIQTSGLGPASDTYIHLYGTDGKSLIDQNDDGGGGLASKIVWQPSADGVYFIKVRHYNPSSFGSDTYYSISVSGFPVAPPPFSSPTGNLAPNPSFEDGTGETPRGWVSSPWEGATLAWQAARSRNGQRSLKIAVTSVISSYLPLHHEWMTDDLLPVDPGVEYTFSAWVYVERAEGNGAAQVVAEFYDSDRVQRGRVTAEVRQTGSWQLAVLRFRPGEVFAATASVSLALRFDGGPGVAFFDDVYFGVSQTLTAMLNPSFEEGTGGPDGWFASDDCPADKAACKWDDTTSHTGKYSLLIQNRTSDEWPRGWRSVNRISIDNSKVYVLSVWVKGTGAVAHLSYGVYDEHGKEVPGAAGGSGIDTTDSWRQIVIRIDMTKYPAARSIWPRLTVSGSTGSVWFDDAYLGVLSPKVTVTGRAHLEGEQERGGIKVKLCRGSRPCWSDEEPTAVTDKAGKYSFELSTEDPSGLYVSLWKRGFNLEYMRLDPSLFATQLINLSDIVVVRPRRITFEWVFQPNDSPVLSGAEVISGTLTTWSGYYEGPWLISAGGIEFKTGKMGRDIVFEHSGNRPTTFRSGPGLWPGEDGKGGIHDMGDVPLENVNTAPNKSRGVGSGKYYESSGIPAVPGHTYVIFTPEGKYAKLRITNISSFDPFPPPPPPKPLLPDVVVDGISLDPPTVKVGEYVDIWVKVSNQGEAVVLGEILVSVYEGDPSSGGNLIGTDDISKYFNGFFPGQWAKARVGQKWRLPGLYQLHATVHLQQSMPEIDDKNNSARLTVRVLPQSADVEAPFGSVKVNNGEAATDSRNVVLKLSAQDNQGGSGVRYMSITELFLDPSALKWQVAATPKWVSYESAYNWTLSEGDGPKYMVVHFADRAGNISKPTRALINHIPNQAPIAKGERKQYRETVEAGTGLSIQLTSTSGDGDLYVWEPGNIGPPTYFSQNWGSSPDALSFAALVSGTYLIEVEGYEAGGYSLAITRTLPVTASQSFSVQDSKGRVPSPTSRTLQGSKMLPSAPLTAAEPPEEVALAPLELPASPYSMYLPLVTKNHQSGW